MTADVASKYKPSILSDKPRYRSPKRPIREPNGGEHLDALLKR
jgi:hypothetical protein